MLVDIDIDGMFVMNASVVESIRCGDGSKCLAKLNIFNEKKEFANAKGSLRNKR